MNPVTAEYVLHTVELLQAHVEQRTPVAIAVLDTGSETPQVITELSYWEREETQEAFERRVATLAKEVGAVRGTLGCPMLVQEDETSFAFTGPTNHPLPPGVDEQLWVFSFDLSDGYYLNRCLFTRRPDGKPVFGEVQTYQGGTEVNEATPGFIMLRCLLEE